MNIDKSTPIAPKIPKPNAELALDSETKRCLLCTHVPFELLVETCLKLIDDPQKAYEVAEKSANIIKTIYIENPPYLCGKSYRGVAGATIYYSLIEKGLIKNNRRNRTSITQERICEILKINSGSLRKTLRSIEDFFLSVKPYKYNQLHFKIVNIDVRQTMGKPHKTKGGRGRPLKTDGGFKQKHMRKLWREASKRYYYTQSYLS